jgi:hypothetical protein
MEITGSEFIGNEALTGGAIYSVGGQVEIKGSDFEGNTAYSGGSNIFFDPFSGGYVTCNDVTNTFEFPPGGITSNNDFQGNYPVLLCIPNCHVNLPKLIGDGDCNNGGDYNTEECGFDGGDCVEFNTLYPGCVAPPDWIDDGYCDGDYNTEECKFDGGDCVEFNTLYPNCTVNNPGWIEDGDCDGGVYNTAECGFDGGDCDDFNSA